ncbi:MAG TPA: adenylyltransferase/cytidyltransferase family protein [Candidatus Bathyarchaeia archaeon]
MYSTERLLIPRPAASQTRSKLATGKTVLATGAFDLLHPGHLRFLEASKKAGGPRAKLIVVVARDTTVLRRKGQKPVMPEDQRREMVAALKPVNRAVLGHEEVDFLGTLRQVQPNIVCVGHDQNDIKKTVEKIIQDERLPIRVVQIARFGPTGFDSSTSLKKQVAKSLNRSH